MEAKHTPGPWEARLYSRGSFEVTASNNIDGQFILASRNNYEELSEEMHANAKLIAAAPELAECLRDLHDFQNGPPLSRYAVEWNAAMERAEELLKRVEA